MPLSTDHRGASEVVGTILLIGVVITTTTIIGGGIVAGMNSLSEQTEQTHVSIQPTVNDTAVKLQHIGGPDLSPNETQILLIGDSGREGPYRLNATEVNGSGLSDGGYNISDSVSVTHDFTGLIEIYLFSTTTDEQLFHTIRSPYTEPALPEISDSEGEHDYGEIMNYRDGDGGDAVQPENPSGKIENPSNVNEEDGDISTAISSGGEEDLNVGFVLPPTDETADTYKMRFVIEDMTSGNGDFGFSLVNSDGDKLTNRQVLQKGDNTYSFSESEEQAISDNYDDIHLILDSETSGKGNREMEMDYFELIAE